jgi:hypothetical protein
VIGLVATGEDPSFHIAKLVLSGVVAAGLLVVATYAFAGPIVEAVRFLRRRRAARR